MATAAAKKVQQDPSSTRRRALAKGEIYRGVTLHDGKAVHLIELPGEFTGTHAEATAWAKEQGGELPSRIDGIVLFEAAKKGEYQRDWYWLAPQPAGGPGYAWFPGLRRRRPGLGRRQRPVSRPRGPQSAHSVIHPFGHGQSTRNP
jgi:hypothetical protein